MIDFPAVYEWRVELRNERQGFQKTFSVNAKDYQEAVTRALSALQSRGYDTHNFSVISLERQTVIEWGK